MNTTEDYYLAGTPSAPSLSVYTPLSVGSYRKLRLPHETSADSYDSGS